jgi:DNA-binding CsgD family transcriptional regulator
VLIANRGARRAAQQNDIMNVYGVTRAEARLVSSLVDGLTLDEYAQKFSVSIATARTQLKSVFSKTGEHRQSALVRHVLSNPILVRGSQD